MGQQVCMGATLKCSFGMAPSTLVVPPINKVITMTPDANIMDHKPGLNIPPFGLCRSLTNPAVASATSSAGGTLTPVPCTPVTLSPWTVAAPTVLLGGKPTLTNQAKLFCAFNGVIEVVSPGQGTVQA